MSQAEAGDAEIRALEAVYEALQPLDDEARNRVVDYTLKRLGMRELPPPPAAPVSTPPSTLEPRPPIDKRPTTDIRSLKDDKNPGSAIEMAAVVAYYLTEVAPEGERKDTVNSADLERYFKQAVFALPTRMANTLPNAGKAGYFDSAARGEYRLNPVGHNLVTQTLPRGSVPPTRKTAASKKSAPTRAKTKKSTRTSRRRSTPKTAAKKRMR